MATTEIFFDSTLVETPTLPSTKVVTLAVFFLLMFQTLFHLSDTAINVLFHFLFLYFKILGKVLHVPILLVIQQAFPSNVSAARKYISSSRDKFTKYINCKFCHSIYQEDTCIVGINKKCSYIRFPNHPHINKRKECGAFLMKKVKTSTGSTVYRPNLVYCYKTLEESLQELLYRPGFFEMCEQWRNDTREVNVYNDIYDGNVGKWSAVFRSPIQLWLTLKY